MRALDGKVALITGGSRGIGRAVALAAAARGFRVVVGYASNQKAADEVVSAIEARKGKAIAVKCDVGSEADILALFKAADSFGTLGALVNNAGIVGPSIRVDQMSAERIQRIMAVNVTGRPTEVDVEDDTSPTVADACVTSNEELADEIDSVPFSTRLAFSVKPLPRVADSPE